MKFTVAIMVKDEESRILQTLYSVKEFADIIYIYDTGSTDETIPRIKKFCEKYDKHLFLKEGEFVDFSTSRNVLLDYMNENEEVEWILLMDANDILYGSDNLKNYLSGNLNEEGSRTSFLMSHLYKLKHCFTAQHYNVTVIKNRNGYYYKRKIHEFVYNDDTTQLNPTKLPEDIYLYQDRINDFKSYPRFFRDFAILKENYNQNKDNPDRDQLDFERDLFYLGQTCLCIAENEKEGKEIWLKEALLAYKIRASFQNACYKEETFNAMCLEATTSNQLNCGWTKYFNLLMKAFTFMPSRIEPLILIGEHYYNSGDYIVAFMFIHFACRHALPDVIMSLNQLVWEYDRWRMLALVCFKLGTNNEDLFKAGQEALEVAIKGGRKLGYENPQDIELQELFKKSESKIPINTNMELKTV